MHLLLNYYYFFVDCVGRIIFVYDARNYLLSLTNIIFCHFEFSVIVHFFGHFNCIS